WSSDVCSSDLLGLSTGASAAVLGAQVAQHCREGAAERKLVCSPGSSDLPRPEPSASRAGVSALGGPLAKAATTGGGLRGARLGGATQLLLRSPISLEEGA